MDLKGSSSQAKMESQNGKNVPAVDDKKPPRPQPDLVEKCPRCDSVNTKFCYYNNYSLSQPRYFCKACRRYWTKGGTLRNVPVGGGCRKNRRSAKRAFDNRHHLLVQSHNQMEINNNNNLMLSSTTFDQNITQSSLKLADHSNFSSPLPYEDSGTCDGLSLAFATLQRQSNVEVHHHNLNGFEFELQNSILVHQPITSSGTNTLGFLSNFLEPQTTSSFKYSQGLYNYGFENGGGDQGRGDHHTQPLQVGNEDLKQKMNENRILLGLPWQVGSSNNNIVGQGSLEDNSSSVVFGTGTGSSNYNYYNNDGYYEVEGGDGRSERWNKNTGLAGGAGSAWPNLINTTALIM